MPLTLEEEIAPTAMAPPPCSEEEAVEEEAVEEPMNLIGSSITESTVKGTSGKKPRRHRRAPSWMKDFVVGRVAASGASDDGTLGNKGMAGSESSLVIGEGAAAP